MSEPKFICDTGCIKLAFWLRSLGYDCAHYCDLEKAESGGHRGLFERAIEENRIIVTRSPRITERRDCPPFFLLAKTTDHPFTDYYNLIKKFNLEYRDDRFYSRCVNCNCEFDSYPSVYFTGGTDDKGQVYEPHEPFDDIPADLVKKNYVVDGQPQTFKKCQDQDPYIKCGKAYWWGHQAQVAKATTEKQFQQYLNYQPELANEKADPNQSSDLAQ